MEAEVLIKFCHDQAHEAEHDFEDTVFAALTRQDVWMVCLSLLILSQTFDCLAEEAGDILDRMAELCDVQKDHWRAQ